MNISIQDAANKTGKTVRQLRYLIQKGAVKAIKKEGRWIIDSGSLPGTKGQNLAAGRRQERLREAVDDVLNDEEAKQGTRRFSLEDLKAFQLGRPVFLGIRHVLGQNHPASTAMKRGLSLLAIGCHRFDFGEKAQSYRDSRDQWSLAVCEIALSQHEQASQWIQEIENEVMASVAGLIRRSERKRRRP